MIGYVDTTNLDTMLEGLAWRASTRRCRAGHDALAAVDTDILLRVCREFKIDSHAAFWEKQWPASTSGRCTKLVAEQAKEELGSPAVPLI
jgi:hypothetical protein